MTKANKKTLSITKRLIAMGLDIAHEEIVEHANVPYDVDSFLASDELRTKGITLDALMKDKRVQRAFRAYVKNMLSFMQGMEEMGEHLRESPLSIHDDPNLRRRRR